MATGNAFIFGATGFVGGALARNLKRRGYNVTGTARSERGAEDLQAEGISPCALGLTGPDDFSDTLKDFDVVAYCAMIPFDQEWSILEKILEASRGDGRVFLQTSGTGVLSVATNDGSWDENTFAENDPFDQELLASSTVRLETEDRVRGASQGAFRSMVVRPPMIWGNAGSIQVPRIFDSAKVTGAACYMGKGLNCYSNVHVDDLAEVFALAIEKGQGGALYHAVAGEQNFRTIAEAVGEVTGTGARSITYEEACDLWSQPWTDLAIAVNSRSQAKRTRDELGWVPQRDDLIEDIRSGSYAEAWRCHTGFATNGGYVYSGAHGGE